MSCKACKFSATKPTLMSGLDCIKLRKDNNENS